MSDEQIEMIKWKLMELESADSDCIESNDYEIVGEDEQGRDGYCTIQINTVAGEALATINKLRAREQALALALGLLNIRFEHKAKLLESCEKALEERDASNIALADALYEATDIIEEYTALNKIASRFRQLLNPNQEKSNDY